MIAPIKVKLDRSRYSDILPMPAEGLDGYLRSTGYFSHTLLELERQMAANVKRCKWRGCKATLRACNKSGYCIRHRAKWDAKVRRQQGANNETP